jgi:hypothetical protein
MSPIAYHSRCIACRGFDRRPDPAWVLLGSIYKLQRERVLQRVERGWSLVLVRGPRLQPLGEGGR